MKFYILQNRKDLPKNNPWEPWYDKVFGFIVQAPDEGEARKIASESAEDEAGRWNETKDNPWLDAAFTTCEELLVKVEVTQVILRDFHAA